jgi:methanogenic corrinoid protein MtbC1
MALQTVRTVLGPDAPGGLLAVCCSTEEDFHELPVQLAVLTLEADGGEVVNMGTSTPFYALAEVVTRFGPQLVCVASTIMTNLDRAAREYEDLRKAAKLAGVSIVLGGAGFADAQVRRRFPAELHADSFQELETFAARLTAEREMKG